jgi:hypothetical protein
MARGNAVPHGLARCLLASLAAWGACRAKAATPAEPTATRRFLLSTEGCGRATGYAEANKIVTSGGKTHAAWLDSSANGFRVRIRTLDRRTGRWSPVYTIGKARDNHGGPALTIDSRGCLHVAYFPHHHPMRYRRSTRPNDASGWTEAEQFGKRCTYPTLLAGPDDTLYLTCRESTQKRWVVNLYVRKPSGPWRLAGAILRSRFPGYAHFQEALAWGPDRKTLHLSCRIYEGPGGRHQTVGYLLSRDFGRTWQRADGRAVPVPATAETVDVVESLREAPAAGGQSLRCGAIAVDSAGVPRILYSTVGEKGGDLLLAQPGAGGKWRRRSIGRQLTSVWPGWIPMMPGGLALHQAGRICAVATLCRPGRERGEKLWGHPTSEVAWLRLRDDGELVEASLLSKPDPATPHWLPNLERATGWNQAARPGVIYTAGQRGQKNTDLLSNKAYWACPSERAPTRPAATGAGRSSRGRPVRE